MKPAFFLGAIFPPPAPFPLMLIGKRWSRTRLTANTGVASPMKFVERNIIGLDVIPDLR